jgi:hypothetical protein
MDLNPISLIPANPAATLIASIVRVRIVYQKVINTKIGATSQAGPW